MSLRPVADLEGAALDWAVAKVEGLPVRHDPMGFGNCTEGGYWIWDESCGLLNAVYQKIGRNYSPSSKWEQGGPLLEKYSISVVENLPCSPGNSWEARPSRTAKGAGWRDYGYGPTPLIAAMRCLVAGKLGPTIDIPEELL